MNSAEQIRQVITDLESRFEPARVIELEQALSGLAQTANDNRPAATLIKMMMSVCAYLKTKMAGAHPDTLPVLAGLAEDLDRLLADPGPGQEAIRNILQQRHHSFKMLKAAIATVPSLTHDEMEELKAVILSVDWEISDSTLKNFDTVITRLKEKLRTNKVHFTSLQILHSIGVYVARNKASAHKDSINLLRSVFGNYEELCRTPGMNAEKKKQLVQGDILAYNAFKREIGQSVQPGPVAFEPEPSTLDEDVPPALSHLKSSAPERGSAPLSTLPEPSGEETVVPEAAAKTRDSAASDAAESRDVMGDLFSPKASPADELLDAIHMAELHGTGPGQGLPDASDSDQAQRGIRNFTPERGDATPIPEIEDRLDEFFNLDGSNGQIPPVHDNGIEDREAAPVPTAEFIPEDIPEQALPDAPLPDDGIEAIVPFQYEDESDQEDDARSALAADIMARLEKTAPADLKNVEVFSGFSGDLNRLKDIWSDDAGKNVLLDLIAGMAGYIHNPVTCAADGDEVPPEDSLPSEPEEPEPSQTEAPPKGLWAKIKSMF